MGLAHNPRPEPLTVPDTQCAWKERGLSRSQPEVPAAAEEPDLIERRTPERPIRARHGPSDLSAPFRSILFGGSESAADIVREDQPDFFVDLNLDQVVASVTADRREYDLTPFFHSPLRSVEMIAFRQEVFRDLEREPPLETVGAFARKMRAMRRQLTRATRLRYGYQRQLWFLEAAETYCGAVAALAGDLSRAGVASRGLVAFREYVADYVASSVFTALEAEARRAKAELSAIRYCLQIHGSRIKVSRYDGEADYGAAVSAVFEKFKQGTVREHRAEFADPIEMNHVEAEVLDRVARLYPAAFAALTDFCDVHRDFVDATIRIFDREAQFYLAYLAFVGRVRSTGLPFCYPEVTEDSKEVLGRETFDVALADKLVAERSPVVCNDVDLHGPERILVVSGPNQGGKTTFARAFGQLHYLAALGCPVPGSKARLFLFDRLFTHFERGENIEDLTGKLQDDLLRIHHILDRVTPTSIVILNEIFTSTTLQDAVFLGRKVLDKIIALDLLSVCVTFVDELASLGESTVSMVAAVAPESPATRTYKIVRKPAEGLSYAVVLAEKYGLTYRALAERTAP
jgi:DNA mismatch repair protein MutS